jgi:hypothetical protein
MLYRILKDLAFSFLLCVTERLAERALLPGLHLTLAEKVTTDPVRSEGLSLLIADSIALLTMVWVFTGALYALAWLHRRPLRWQIPPVVALLITGMTFLSAWATYATRPSIPTMPPAVSVPVGR